MAEVEQVQRKAAVVSPLIAYPVIYTLVVFIAGWLYAFAGRDSFSPWWLLGATPLVWWAGAALSQAVWLPHYFGEAQARSGAALAAWVGAGTGGWLTYAGRVGTERAAPVLGLLALGGWLAFAVVTLRAPRREAERAQVLAARESLVEDARWRAILDKAGAGDVLITGKREHRAGLVLTCEPDPERDRQPTYEDFAGRVRQIAMHAAMDYRRAGAPLPRNAVWPEPGSDDAEFLLNVTTRDVFTDATSYVADYSPRDICDAIDIGEYEDASRILEVVLGAHRKIVGMTGSGKTVVTNNYIARISACSNALVWVCATDKLVPLVFPWLRSWFEGRAGLPLLDYVAGKHVKGVLGMLADAYRLACERNDRMADESKLRPTAAEPAVFVFLEEATHAMEFLDTIRTHDGQDCSVSDLVMMITRAGRSAGVHLVVLAQTAINSALGDRAPEIIRNITARTCLRTMESHDGYRTLPGLPANVDTTSIPLHTMILQPSIDVARAVPGKAPMLDGTEQIDPIAARQASWRAAGVEADSRLGDRYANRWSIENHPELARAVARAGLPWREPGGPALEILPDEDGPADEHADEYTEDGPVTGPQEGEDMGTVWTDEDEAAFRGLLEANGGEPDRPRPFELPDSRTGVARLRRLVDQMGAADEPGPAGPVREPVALPDPLDRIERWLEASEDAGVVHGPDHEYMTDTIADGIGWETSTHALGLRLARFGLRSANVSREVDPDRRKGYRVADLREAITRARFAM